MYKSVANQNQVFRIWLWPSVILAVGSVFFICVVRNETATVYQLWTSPWPVFREIMSRSIYEGGAFGGSDISVTIAGLAFLKWLKNRRNNIESPKFTQRKLKFVWMTSLVASIAAVHSLKWIVSRARPKVFFSHELFPRYSLEQLQSIEWAGFMPWNGARGLSWNSFPSGHTATATILLIVCYLYWPSHRKLSIFLWIIFTMFAAAMGIARSMAGMHWLSDSIASYFLVWCLIHIISSKMKIHDSE